jgi:murein DD-endopeptidase / murein LD-carboxypeptidase
MRTRNFQVVNRLPLYLLWVVLGWMITSCSPSTGARTSKYSSANKRSSSKHTSKENRTYTSSKKTKESESTSKANVSSLRQSIVSTALQLQGTSYRSGGKSPDSGFDCSGFTGYIFSQNGIPISGPSHKIAEMGKEKSKSQLMPGDLIFFGNSERISHVGIVSETNGDAIKVVHATTSAGVKVDNITNSEYWTTRYLFAKDVIGK